MKFNIENQNKKIIFIRIEIVAISNFSSDLSSDATIPRKYFDDVFYNRPSPIFLSFYSFIYFLSRAIEHLITAYIQKDCVRHMGMIYIWLKSTIIFFWQFLLTLNVYTEHSRRLALNGIKRLYMTPMRHTNNNSIYCRYL